MKKIKILNHTFFYSYNKFINLLILMKGNLDLKIEKTSNDTYLRKNKLSSTLFKI